MGRQRSGRKDDMAAYCRSQWFQETLKLIIDDPKMENDMII